MKKIRINLNFLLTLVLFLFIIFISFLTIDVIIQKRSNTLFSFKNLLTSSESETDIGKKVLPTLQASSSIEDKVIVTGVIRTTGLSSEEKKKLDLELSNFQITDFGKATFDQKTHGYFLESDDLFSKNYLGKCVKIEGRLVPGWEELTQNSEKNSQFTYGNLAIIPENIIPVEMIKCDPYEERIQGEKNLDLATFSGTLKHRVRPAPDIGYDYLLFLNEEYLDTSSSTGSPELLEQIDITPFSNNIWIEIQEKIDQKVTLEGYYLWGYAESKYMEVHSVK